MGYTLSVKPSTQTRLKSMLALLDKEFHPWGALATGLSGSAGLPYQEGNTLAIDYASHCQGRERFYVYTLVRWMAIKITKPRKIKPFHEPMSYYLYEDEIIPVYLCTDLDNVPLELQAYAVDFLGITRSKDLIRYLVYETPSNAKLEAVEQEAIKTLGVQPTQGPEREAWRAAYLQELREALATECSEMVDLVRTEIQRLDQLWCTR